MRSLPLLVLVLAGCNRYDLFRVAGYQQLTFSNKADILFVMDNSDSMTAEATAVAVNFNTFISKIDATDQALSYEGLPDAVDNFVEQVKNRSSFLDYQFAVTTTDVGVTSGELLGPVITRGDEDVSNAFIGQLACEGTCWDTANPLPIDDQYKCGDPLENFITQDFMNCECGSGYTGHCGAAQEEGLEAVYLAMCRAVPNPPTECFADVVNEEAKYPSLLKESDIGSNAGMLRENAAFIPVIVSDEGDGSRREDPTNGIPSRYANLFDQFGQRMTWVLLGNTLDADGHVHCPGAASDWGVERYFYMTHVTDGEVINMYDDHCDTRGDFETALGQLSDLLVNLLTSFPLQSVPVPGTVIVLVDKQKVLEAEVTGQDQFGFDEYSDGWTYRAADNSVLFHGNAIPDYNANVEVFYQPVDGMPRSLPF